MAVAEPKPHSEPKVWNFFKLPFRHSTTTSSTGTTSSSPNLHHPHHHQHHHNPNSNAHNLPPLEGSTSQSSNSVSSVARSLLPTRRRLKLDPSNKLYFPCMFRLFLHFSLLFLHLNFYISYSYFHVCVFLCMQFNN